MNIGKAEIPKRSGALECVAASDFADLWPE